jgi:hypothetical protein
MKAQDKEDFNQFKKLKKHTGRKASDRQLAYDYMRKHFNELETAKDAFHHRIGLPISESVKDDKKDLIESFIDDIEDLKLTQRVLAILIYCGFTLRQIRKILGVKHDPQVYKMLRGKRHLWQNGTGT